MTENVMVSNVVKTIENNTNSITTSANADIANLIIDTEKNNTKTVSIDINNTDLIIDAEENKNLYKNFTSSETLVNTITLQGNIFKNHNGIINMKQLASDIEYTNIIIGMEYFDIIGIASQYKDHHGYLKKIKKSELYIMGYPCSKKRRKLFIRGEQGNPSKGFNNSLFMILNIDDSYNVEEYYKKNDSFIESKIKHIKLFKNGRLQITGCKSIDEINIIFDNLKKELHKYIKNFKINDKEISENDFNPHFIHINMYDVIYSIHKTANFTFFDIYFNMRALFNLLKIESNSENPEFLLSHNKKTIMPLKLNLWIKEENEEKASCLKIVIYKNGYIIITGANSYEKIETGKKKINEFLDRNYDKIIRK
jgi:hypothetical protein